MSKFNALIEKVIGIITPQLWEILTSHEMLIVPSPKSSLKFSLAGRYVTDSKLIYIFHQNAGTIIHEIGHFIFDHPILGRFFKNAALYDIFISYRDRLKNGGSKWSSYDSTTIDVKEYFAEGFEFYFVKTELLFHSDPDLFHYINNSLEDLFIHFGHLKPELRDD